MASGFCMLGREERLSWSLELLPGCCLPDSEPIAQCSVSLPRLPSPAATHWPLQSLLLSLRAMIATEEHKTELDRTKHSSWPPGTQSLVEKVDK